MSQYTITYSFLYDTGAKFNSVSEVLEANRDTLMRMSGDVMKGFENEGRMMANWARIVEERKNDVRKASDCLKSVVTLLNDSEKTAHGLVSDFNSIKKSGSHGGRHSDMGGYGSTEGRWGSIRDWIDGNAGSRDWSSFTTVPWWSVLPPMAYILPFIMSFDSRQGVLDFIRDLFSRKNDSSGQGSGSGGGSNCVSPDIDTGCGEMCVDSGEFTDAESCVNSEMGVAACLIGGGAAAGAAIGSGGGGSGSGGGGGGGSGAYTDGENLDDLPEFDENIDIMDGEDYLSDYDNIGDHGYDTNENGQSIVDGNTTAGSSTDSSASGGLQQDNGTGMDGLRVAAPVIGAASVGSMAAAGAVLGRDIQSQRDEALQEGEGEQEIQEIPAISAQQSEGVFTGNFDTEYTLLAAVISLVFVGLSIATAAHKKKDKSNDRFKRGYGVSAVLDSGEIQVR